MLLILVLIVVIVIACLVLYSRRIDILNYYHQDIFGLRKAFGNGTQISALIVISHPDDECMFFGPTIYYLLSKNITVHILCLSTGDFYGIGPTRRVELLNSCLKLKINPAQVHQLDSFKDDINEFWDEREVAAAIDKFIRLSSAKILLTFDERGVSGHPNHISAFKGALNIKASVPIYKLDSVNTLRKYIHIADILLSFRNSYVIVSSREGVRAVYNAMLCHKSQLTWFRRLYMIFSRYVIINTWTKIK